MYFEVCVRFFKSYVLMQILLIYIHFCTCTVFLYVN